MALWRRVTSDVQRRPDERFRPQQALSRDGRRSARAQNAKGEAPISEGGPTAKPPDPTAATPKKRKSAPSSVVHRSPTSSARPKTTFHRAPDPVRDLGDGAPGLDGATARRLRRGDAAPDARIDLHGMTAHSAHQALCSFIMRQRAAGARCVLVITGKGGRGGDEAGILRRQAPHWLRQAPLSGHVLDVYGAHRRHGGDGALYVYLRKRRPE